MQITDLDTEQKITPLLRLGFRPFFLFGAIASFVLVFLWLFILKGAVNLAVYGGGYWWHMHEMVFGFGAAIIAGFLLTAVQNWTGVRGVQGKLLLALILLWLAGRLTLVFPQILGTTASAIIDISFLPAIAWVLGKPIIAIKQYRNLFFVPLLLVFTIANIQMHMAIAPPSNIMINLSGYTGVMLTILLMSIMAGRVVPMFTANGTQTPKVSPLPWLEKATNGGIAGATIMLLLHPIIGFNHQVFGLVLIFAGFTQGIRWFRWRPWVSLAVPLVWSLHVSLKFVWFGLILLGVSYVMPEVPSNHIWHLLTVGGMGGLILAMISRVSLGHSGRPLVPPKAMTVAYIAIAMAAIIRSFGPWGSPEHSAIFYDISGMLWFIGFGIFAWFYGPMLAKPRADGRPG